MHIGVLPLARPTFDVAYASARLRAMFRALEDAGFEPFGPRDLLLDAGGASEEAMEEVLAGSPECVLVLQATFTDASFVARLAEATTCPLAIWSPPEPRLGGRLRLNAFCGLNLASHALGLRGRGFAYLYADPDAPGVDVALGELFGGSRQATPLHGKAQAAAVSARAQEPMRIARIGAAPEGFDTCHWTPESAARFAGAQVDEWELDDLFERAGEVADAELARIRSRAAAKLRGLAELDSGEVDRSLRIAGALEVLRSKGGYDGFAIRCWPEAFTEYGGAICGPVSLLGDARVPCACESDVFGAATQVLLQRLCGEAVFLSDLVDVDIADGTGVLWHCGQAPRSMADPESGIRATVHGNRGQALLYEFALKPGRITLVRLSQARQSPKFIVATGEMLRRPLAFSGTAGVVRFDRPAGAVLEDIMNSGVEHHLALAYGDHLAGLESLAARTGLPFLELGRG